MSVCQERVDRRGEGWERLAGMRQVNKLGLSMISRDS